MEMNQLNPTRSKSSPEISASAAATSTPAAERQKDSDEESTNELDIIKLDET